MNMTLETIFEAAHRESAVLFALDEVERRLHRLTAAREGLCARLAAHVIQAGGKRLRPLLVILCGGPGPDREPVLDVAVAAELIHTASLIHDDILDGADTRRGVPTINALWGNHAAVLTGDFLFAAAFGLLAGEQTRGAMALMTEAVQAMCQGEMEEGESLFQTSLTEDAYIAHIEKKTASLLAACCGAGALAGGASPETAAALAAFGRNLGLAYQIVDDLLDFSSDDCTLGKPANSDLARGVLTLPVIYLLQEGSHRAAVEEIIAGRACGPEGFARIKKAAEETAALAYAYQKALHFAGQARDCLASIPYLPSREMLLALAGRVVSRKS
ncbi:MAG TPA: polyprenyl synthetase family protein [Syntrophomonadaceae bacterium]|nr:polyprenyl synthetase family protein [Syntrophomonadaceae bacterium]